MSRLLTSALLTLCVLAPLRAAEKTATLDGFSVTYDDATFPSAKAEEQKKLTNQKNGSDIPTEVGPKHPLFVLHDKRAAGAEDLELNRIEIFPLADASVKSFASAYPDVSGGAKDLAAFLKSAPTEIPWISQDAKPSKKKAATVPALRFYDAAFAFQAKPHYFENDQLHGVFYLVEYTQESTFYPVNGDIFYAFAGLSKDGRFSITAEFSVAHPSLPANFDAAPEAAKNGKVPVAELKKIVAALAAQPDDSFTPKLADLQAIVASLKLPAK